ncbi:alpha/beta hydrolase [Roseomonas sp. SSH11]|uniref:Alpha/beta hydrolase n=1 Tax=Pararoseomonas baculiformis TaxID=2820812 RepID=A0ABS4AIL9_9PROT|nr:alpha/beta hydrolase [Pararoseomonas baculiformis]MBP0446878.1 alpha/beta hydrolase [Pararoseomonas baculiformis]
MSLLARIAILAVLLLVLLVLAPAVTLWAMQERFLFPVRHGDTPVAASGIWRTGHVELPGAGRIAFLHADTGANPEAPVLLYLHGNASSAALAATITTGLAEAGIPVVAAEYPGYSGNPGAPSEAALKATAEATAAWARARWPTRRLAVLGESIGSAPAVHLAATGVADLLVIDSGFTSMTETIRQHMPWLPGLAWLNRHPMDSIGALRAAASRLPPTLVMVSAEDSVVPTAMGEALAAAIPGSRLVRSEWSGHPVLYGDPPSRQLLLRWLLAEGSRR